MTAIQITQATEAANTDWKHAVYVAIGDTAAKKATFTIDDVWDVLDPTYRTRDKRAVGGVMLRARRNGVIEATGKVRTTRPSHRSRSKSVIWRSLVFAGL